MDLGLKSGQFDLVTHVCGAIATLCEGRDSAKRQGEPAGDDAGVVPGYHLQENRLPDRGERLAGALAVGASVKKQALMRKFSESIGMAFQIQDDILDYTRTARTGKPSNNDLREPR